MDWLAHKYIGIVSPRLEKFKRKSSNLYQFRCPVCGDSENNQNKARGYIYQKEGKMMFHCHNCGATMGIPNFIKMIDVNIYNEYQLEKLQDRKTPEQDEYEKFIEKMKTPVFMKTGILKGLKKVSQLHHDNPIKKFVVDRKIPNEYHARLFACNNFKNYVNNLIPNKFNEDSLLRDETRLLIPYINKEKSVHAMNFRSIAANSSIKYIKTLLNEDIPNVYGLDTVEFNKKVYVFEGEFDSMFVKNAIASGGGDIVSAIKSFPKENIVIVYDNEKRSKETINKLQKAIYNGYSVCIWPDNLEPKDVNEMILSGLSSEFIEHIINQNTYRDLSANLALTKWKNV